MKTIKKMQMGGMSDSAKNPIKKIARLQKKENNLVSKGNKAVDEGRDKKADRILGRAAKIEDRKIKLSEMKKGGAIEVMAKTVKKSLPKAQKGGPVKPTYSDIKGSGSNYFKTPTAKDSSDYRKGFEQGLKKSDLKQSSFPSGATIRGYNEGFKKVTTKKKG